MGFQIQLWEKTSSHQMVNFEHKSRDFQTQHLQSDCPKRGLLSKNFGQLGPSKARTTIGNFFLKDKQIKSSEWILWT